MYKKSVLWMAAIGLMLMTSTVFTSCKDDDDDDETGSSELIGTWQSVTSEVKDGNYSYSGAEGGEILTFRNDGTGTWGGSGDEVDQTKWKVEGDLLYLLDEEDFKTGEWSVYKIIKLTSTEMILDFWYNPNGDSDRYRIVTFKKVN
jgi:predicted lactoylglutathione lyase